MKLSTFVFRSSIISSQLNRLIRTYFKPFPTQSQRIRDDKSVFIESAIASGCVNPRFNVVALLIHSTYTLGIPYLASLLNHDDARLLHLGLLAGLETTILLPSLDHHAYISLP